MKIPFVRSAPFVLFACLSCVTLMLTFDHVFQSLDTFYDGPSRLSSSYSLSSHERVLSSSNDDLANYENPSDTYSPSMQVEYGHKLTGQEFEANQEYIQRALYTPVVIFGLGFLAIFMYLCGMLWRCCCECCRCLPDADDIQYDYKRTTNTVFFYLFLLFVLLFDQLVFIGNTNIDQGISTLDTALGDILSLTTSVNSDTSSLVSYSASLQADYNSLVLLVQSECPAYASGLDSAESSITDFATQVNSLDDAVSQLPDHIETAQKYLDQYAMTYRTIGIYVIWALAIVCVILFCVAKVVESAVTMKVSLSLGVFTFLLYLVLGVPWVLITSIAGDFCMAPTYNLVKSAPSGDLRNMLRYYSSCLGNSTIDGYIQQGVSGVTSLNTTLNDFRAAVGASSTCGSSAELTGLFLGVRSVNDTVNSVLDTLSCPNIRDIYFDIVNVGFCEELYSGVFYIWGSQLVTSFCLFVVIIVASVSYQYFDVARIVPMNNDDNDNDEENNNNEDNDDKGHRNPNEPRLEMVDLGNNHHDHHHHNKTDVRKSQDYHNAQAYSSVGYFDSGLSPRS